MLRGLKKKGFASILEVIVTSIVFVLAAAGILSTVVMLKPLEKESSQKIEAAYVGKGVIDELRSQVDATDWYEPGSNLAPGSYSRTMGNYTIVYKISEPIPDVRRLIMNVTW